MDLRQLRLFIAVTEERNLTRAAERVNLSQPALSYRIRQLEEELGVALFRRTPRGVELTAAGEALLPDAQQLLSGAEAAIVRVRRAGGLTDDRLRVGFDFIEFGSVGLMPSLLSVFRERYPSAALDLEMLDEDALEQAVSDSRLDIAFLLGPPANRNLQFHPLLRGEYVLVLPAAHPLTLEQTVSRHAIAATRLLLPRLRATDEAALLAWLNTENHQTQVVFKGTNVATLLGLVAAGEGVAVLPSGLAKLQAGTDVVVRSLKAPPLTWTFGLTWHRKNPTGMARLAQQQLRRRVSQPELV